MVGISLLEELKKSQNGRRFLRGTILDSKKITIDNTKYYLVRYYGYNSFIGLKIIEKDNFMQEYSLCDFRYSLDKNKIIPFEINEYFKFKIDKKSILTGDIVSLDLSKLERLMDIFNWTNRYTLPNFKEMKNPTNDKLIEIQECLNRKKFISKIVNAHGKEILIVSKLMLNTNSIYVALYYENDELFISNIIPNSDNELKFLDKYKLKKFKLRTLKKFLNPYKKLWGI
ncbi:TPA: hypothetical protein ACF2DD_002947 [Clostridium perfringens]|uniref:hypothetical protein n=1 Tax=Clostridium perfringens TaxID=1502 RepID=UPI0007769F62|nr:hypothetical protein [Clostridium perfringens]AMN30801.1 hypothetical protein JFP55_pH0013 [Clostridium perfringens]EIF6165900.1 hypothetical protein [Clostridium perfringens]